MKKILLLLICFNAYLFSNSSILIVNSYHKGYEYSDDIVKGIEEVLYKDGDIDVTILYMDSKRITSKEYFDNLKKLYKVQLKNRKYDLVITIDKFSYEFILENYKSFFTNEKILALGIKKSSRNKINSMKLKNKISAYLITYNLNKNIKLINKIMPNLDTLYIIDDANKSLNKKKEIKKNILLKYKNFKNIEYVRAQNLYELNLKFSISQKNAAILFIKFYKNKNGKLNKNIQIANFIKKSKVPVFVNDSIFTNKGALGGRVLVLKKFGINSGKMALEFINTNKTSIKTSNDFEHIYDYQKLKEFKLTPLKYVKNYKLVNKDMTFLDKNRAFINYVFLLSPLLIILIFALIKNIYKRYELEKKLRKRLHFDTVMLNAIQSPILWLDKQGVIIDANSKFCALINIEMTDLHNKKLEDLPLNKNIKKVIKVLEKCKNNKSKNIEFKIIDEKLNNKLYLIKETRYKDEKTKNSGTVAIFTDITRERAIFEEQKRNQQFMVQQSKLAELGEIFSAIAHQWKAPLVEITTIAQEIFYSSSKNELNESESYVGDIIKQVKYMNDTINDFQEFIKPSHEKHKFSALEAINDMLEIVNHNIKFNYIKIDICVKEDTNLEVYGYRNEFMQSFLNIINNAKDVLIKNDFNNRHIKINIFNEKKHVIIEIIDNAGGIKNKDLEKIFSAYFSTKEEGHGLGLYMAKVIIEDKMMGKISVKNVKQGACFTIKIGQDNENTNT